MAKILVADDNSNIQKMVALALKDQGIDVVAVGNGEAAVRKISDVHPDLVLADVFMPVRNGYEVCQYVKTDSALAHIPVILLVGAFDPLDEQEAQRVGADGVLKKPFVPPDPLISMVKSALQRAGVAHGNASSAKTTEPAGLRAADLLTPSAGVPTVSSTPLPKVSHDEPIAALENESFADEIPARPEPVRIDSGSQPVAFGTLLETPAREEAEDDAAFMPPVHSELEPDRDWREPDVEETNQEEEEKTAASWRHEEADSYADAESGSGAKDWRAGGFEQIARVKARSWEPEEEKPELVETAPAANNIAKDTPAGPASVTQATPVSPAAPFAGDALSPAPQEKASAETVTAVEEAAPTASSVASSPEIKQAQPQKEGTTESWFSVPTNPWDAEIKKANQLASTWDAPAESHAVPPSNHETEKVAESVSEATKAAIEEAALPAVAVEAIREEAAQVAEDATHAALQQNLDGTGFYAREETPESPAPAPSMDELVARVLAKMSPDVLQAVTREILKPVVEAMVKEELKSKKS